MLENTDDPQKLKEKFLKQELQTRKLLDEQGVLDQKIQKDLKHGEKLEKSLFLEIPRILILWDLLRYYLTTSYDRRSKHSGPFPYLRPGLDSNQIKAFQDFKPGVVRIMQDYLPEKIENLSGMGGLLSRKFAVEKQMKGLHLQMTPVLGAAILATSGSLSPEKTAELFSVSLQEVRKGMETLETFQKPSTTRAQRFMDMVRG
jgi:Zn-finger domain-containing protein